MNSNLARQLVVLLAIFWSSVWLSPYRADAANYRTVETSSPQEVMDAIANKAVRGVANIATGWVEFPKQIYLTSKEDGLTSGLFVGPLRGLGMTLVRTISGVGETLTFFMPFPGFYDPYFEPAYVWQKE